MSNTLPPTQGEQRASARTPGEKSNRAAASVGILVACLVLLIISIYLAARIHTQSAALADVKAQLTQSNSRADETQANVDTVKAQLSALQAQAASEQGQRSNIQSQLDQAKAQSSSLQVQLAGDQGQLSDLQSQLEQARERSAGFQAQFARARQESVALRTQLEQARSEAADAKAQLAKAQVDLTKLHPLLLQARQLPLVATFEKSFWDQGFTLHINNPGSDALNVTITISGTDKTRAERAVIEGGATLNVGRLPAGDNVVLASEGFDPLNLTAR